MTSKLKHTLYRYLILDIGCQIFIFGCPVTQDNQIICENSQQFSKIHKTLTKKKNHMKFNQTGNLT